MAQDSDKNNSEVDADLIRGLAALLDETGLSEIEIETNGKRLRVARQLSVAAVAAPVAAVAAAPVAAAPEAAGTDLSKHPGAVPSPMVGMVYTSSEAGTPPFVSVGDIVSTGQTLLIIEAMKHMNPIPSPQSGKVVQILVDNESPVEFGQPLMIIE